MSLSGWQEHLEKHFSALSSQRDSPLFAFEHGLDDGQLTEIERLLNSSLAEDLDKYWLVWVVYATEFGYSYYGDEYWDTFERKMRRWPSGQNHRNNLYRFFYRFHERFRGVKPSGRWANHFSIIAWPITHSILPSYHQRQLAQVLYGLRHELTRLDNLSPISVGDLIGNHAVGTTNRFRDFLQQKELVGRIVLSLLEEEGQESAKQNLIYGPTLQRILSDLKERQNAGHLLTATRQVFSSRFKGLSSIGRNNRLLTHSAEGSAEIERKTRPVYRFSPEIILRRSGKSTWSPVIKLPEFPQLAQQNPELEKFLKSTRVKIPRSSDTWFPRGWLFYPDAKTLHSWPDQNEVLIQFEEKNGLIDYIASQDFKISAGNLWLYRIGSDGIAYEIRGRHIRPGNEYILLSKSPCNIEERFLKPHSFSCKEVHSFYLSIPQPLSVEDLGKLQEIGLSLATTIQIEPIGLSARAWDGEGNSEWLTTERPHFCITQDHEVESYTFALNNSPPQILKASNAAAPILIGLPLLEAGKHTLKVSAFRSGGHGFLGTYSSTEGILNLEVRNPRAWIAGTASHSGLTIRLEPYDSSLDTFLEGRSYVSILGPESHKITCSLSLEVNKDEEDFFEKIDDFTLPISRATWTKALQKFLKSHGEKCLEANSGKLVIKSNALGEKILRLENEIAPLRWICRSAGSHVKLRLVDDTGVEENFSVEHYSFSEPVTPSPIALEEAFSGITLDGKAGLFLAKKGKVSETIIVDSSRRVDSLTALGVTPNLTPLNNQSSFIEDLLKSMELWSGSRAIGIFGRSRQETLIKELKKALYRKICGDYWVRKEDEFLLSAQASPDLLKKAINISFAAAIQANYKSYLQNLEDAERWFSEVAKRYNICVAPEFSEFIFTLANTPEKVVSKYSKKSEPYIKQAYHAKELMCGARLLVLLMQKHITAIEEQEFKE